VEKDLEHAAEATVSPGEASFFCDKCSTRDIKLPLDPGVHAKQLRSNYEAEVARTLYMPGSVWKHTQDLLRKIEKFRPLILSTSL